MYTQGLEFEMASELVEYGKTEDGYPFIGECYFVMFTNVRGDRWTHRHRFHGVKVEHYEEGIIYRDTRTTAKARCEKLLKRIKAAGLIDMQYWSVARPMYGSRAYEEYGQQEDLLWEKQQC